MERSQLLMFGTETFDIVFTILILNNTSMKLLYVYISPQYFNRENNMLMSVLIHVRSHNLNCYTGFLSMPPVSKCLFYGESRSDQDNANLKR